MRKSGETATYYFRTIALKQKKAPGPQKHRLVAFHTLPALSFLLRRRRSLGTGYKAESSGFAFFYVGKLTEGCAFVSCLHLWHVFTFDGVEGSGFVRRFWTQTWPQMLQAKQVVNRAGDTADRGAVRDQGRWGPRCHLRTPGHS